MSSSVAVNDLTKEVTSEEYWKILAESRSQAVEETSLENHDLRKYIALLDEKLNQQRAELAQACLEVKTLREILDENGQDVTSLWVTTKRTLQHVSVIKSNFNLFVHLSGIFHSSKIYTSV